MSAVSLNHSGKRSLKAPAPSPTHMHTHKKVRKFKYHCPLRDVFIHSVETMCMLMPGFCQNDTKSCILLLNTAALQTEAALAPGEPTLRLQMMTYWIINAAAEAPQSTADATGCLLVFYFSWFIFPILPCNAGIPINNHLKGPFVRLWPYVVVQLI